VEIDDKATAIDTLTNKIIATVPIGQAAQGVAYVPNAVPESTGPELGNAAMSSAGAGTYAGMTSAGAGMPGPSGMGELQPLGVAGEAARYQLTMAPPGNCSRRRPTDNRRFYRVRHEAQTIFGRCFAEWQALPPPVLKGATQSTNLAIQRFCWLAALKRKGGSRFRLCRKPAGVTYS
jgi:hypothetical protein